MAAPAAGARVSGLRNGVAYSFRVFAVNAAGSSAPAGPVTATPSTGVEGVVAGLIVEFAPGSEVTEGDTEVPGDDRVTQVDLAVAEKVTDDSVLVEFSEPVDLATAEQIASDLAADEQVIWAEPDQFFFTSTEEKSTNDPVQTVSVPVDSEYSTSQWNLWDTYGVSVGDSPTSMTDAWAGPRGDGVTVAVIDTGITSHPDLDGQLVSGYDFVSNPEQLASSRQANAPPVPFDSDYQDTNAFGVLGRDDNPTDPGDWSEVAPVRNSSWHGTKIAGLIAAAANEEGVTGIAPNSKIQPVRALSWRGGLLSDIAASITWASGGEIDGVPTNQSPSKVINMSFAVETICPTALQDAINGARERGSILIAAAGNANDDAAKFAPGNCNGVITVGASNRDGNRTDYSNYGDTIDISAPGGDAANPITSTSNTGTQTPDQPTTAGDFGTSIAAAHVSAAAAILASRNAELTPDQAYEQITSENFTKAFANEICDTTNPDYSCGTGILNLAQIAGVASGDQDYALSFSGTSNSNAPYGQSVSTTFLSSIQGAFTFETWVKPTSCSNGENTVFMKEFSFGLDCQLGYWRYQLGKGVDWSGYRDGNTGVAPQIGQWQHVAVARSAQNASIEFYFNGQLAHTGAAWDFAIGNNANYPLYVGARPGAGYPHYFVGQIDELRFYSTYRGSSVATDMSTYGPTDTTGLIAYYDFNEGPAGSSGTGTAMNRVSGAATSTSLRLIGGPTYADVKQVTSNGSNTVVTFPRSYINAAGGWRVANGVTTAQTLVVAGGGGGGAGFDNTGWMGGGGGAGGYLAASSTALTAGAVTAVRVGTGGLQAIAGGRIAANGQSSTLGTLTTIGGGGGGTFGASGAIGGSGGGGAMYSGSGGAATTGQGNAGGNGAGTSNFAAGGGGGSGGAGTNGTGTSLSAIGGSGGAGTSNAITGSAVTYAAGANGRGCGANGSTTSGGQTTVGSIGAANRGSGGGAGGDNAPSCSVKTPEVAGSGGSGVVIVSYASPAICNPSYSNYLSGGISYRVATFADPGSCTWTVPSGVSSVDVVLVAGGGGGGGSIGGGGGGGEFKSLTGTSVTSGSSQTIVVGTGGTVGVAGVGSGGNGGNSSALGTTVKGGGGGATLQYLPAVGGSGGGGLNCGYAVSASGAGTSTLAGGLANSGGAGSTVGSANCVGGGGGGAGGVGGTFSGQNGGTGGTATSSTITGSTTLYAAGGGGGINGNTGALSTGIAGAGGSGIGGAGGSKMSYSSDPNNLDGLPGMAGTGSGGGGASNSGYGGLGGSGTVILRYSLTATTTCTGSVATTTSDGYFITAFKSTGSCTWTPPPGTTSIDYLVVAGGGGGGTGRGGGGGAGGMQASALSVTAGTPVSLTVGAGGAAGANDARGSSGANSVLGSVTSTGGGGGGGWNGVQTGLNGGSGGGAAGSTGTSYAGGTGTATQGNDGGRNAGASASCTAVNESCGGGGGGGAAAAGSQGTNTAGGAGGAGSTVSWLTTTVSSNLSIGQTSGGAVYFAGGGGGGAMTGLTGGTGGLGGGASGLASSGTTPAAATANTGGGGGGNEGAAGPGSAGGSGVVVIRYAQPTCAAQTSTYSTYVVVEFQGAGTCSWTPASNVTLADVLVVGGGGGGGAWVGGGGGGGGFSYVSGVTVSSATAITVTVGAGGAGAVNTGTTPPATPSTGGGTSSFGAAATALGGGQGASYTVAPGGAGFANGGGGGSTIGGSGSSGNQGGSGNSTDPFAAGGGAGSGVSANGTAGSSYQGGTGGSGTSNSITGSAVIYSGGGGGVHGNYGISGWGTPGIGGAGGGGVGASATSTTDTPRASSGADGLGGGGGGAAAAGDRNSFGGDGGDGTVIVSYSTVPNEPTSVTGTASAPTEATVAWTAPTSIGGSAITGYTVQVSAAGGAYANAAAGTCQSTASTSTSTSCTVTGLTAGTTYAFKVTPINANGNGTQSSASSTITAYGALDRFAVTTTGDAAVGTQTAGTSFNVKITAQDSGNRTVTNFTGTVDLTSTSLFSAGSGTTAAFTAGVLSSTSLTLTRAGSSQTLTATRTSGGVQSGTSAAFTVNVGTANKLQVLLPGETAAPGTSSGKTGTPTAQTAGTALSATVNAVDADWNLLSSATQTIAITSTDSAAVLPSNAALVSGTRAFAVTLWTSGTPTITATVASGSALTANTSTAVTVNKAAQATLSMSSASSVTFGDTLTLSTSGGSGSGAVTFAVSTAGTAGCSISGSTLSLTGVAGSTCAVTATKAADASYVVAASSAQTITVTTRQITVSASSPSIAFGATVAPSVSVSTGTLSGSDAISGATYTYVGTGGTSYASSTTAPTAVGTYSVTPSAAVFSTGTASNYAITYVAGTLTISKASQTITFPTVTSKTYGAAAFTVTASVPSGLTVTFTSQSTSVCTSGGSNGATFTIVAAGSCIIRAGQAGNASYNAASEDQTVAIDKAELTVTASSPTVLYGASVPEISPIYGTFAYGENSSALSTLPTCTTIYTVTSNVASAPSTSCSGATAANYTFRYIDGAVVVSRAPITVTAAPQAVAFSSPVSSVTGSGSVTYAGFKNGQGTDIITGTVSSYTTTYTTTTPAGTAGVTITPNVSGLSATNYFFTAVAGTVTVNKTSQAALTLTSTTGTYGTEVTLATSGGTTGGALSYSVANGTATGCAVSSGKLTSTSAGTCSVTATMAGSGDYDPVSSAATSVTLSPIQLTMTGVSAANKQYDGNQTATLNFTSAALVGVLSADSAAVGFNAASASGTFASDVVANNVVVTVSGVTLTGAKASSYALTQPTGVTANITLASRTLTFATTSYSKTYGDAPFTVTATPSIGTGTVTYSATGTGCTVGSATGVVTIIAASSCQVSASIASDGSYGVASTSTPVSVSVARKGLTVTGFTASNKDFDDTTAATVTAWGSLSGVVGSDSVSINSSSASAAFVTPDVGSAIVVNATGVALTGTEAGNYTVTQPATTANISARALTITAATQRITFGASTPTPSFTTSGLQGNDAVSTVTYAYTGANAPGAPTAGGTYSITPSAANFSSGTASNYSITYTAGVYTIDQAAQTITFTQLTDVTYGVAPLSLTATAGSGLTVSFASQTTPICTVSGSTLTIVAVGTCTIRATQTGNGNYSAAPAIDNTFAVNRAQLTITASSPTVTYGDAVPTITASYSGFVNSQSESVLSTLPSCTTAYSVTSNALSAPATTCSGAATGNYSFVYVNGSVLVNRAPLQVTASSPSVTYGDPIPTITPSYSGFVNGQGVSAFTSPMSCTTTYTRTSNSGTTPATSCSGAAAANYSFSYVSGAVTIARATPTIALWSGESKTYGNAAFAVTAPTVTGVTGAELPGSISYTSGTTSVATISGVTVTIAGAGSSVVTASFSPTDTTNYNSNATTMTLTVAKTPLTVTASSSSVIFGANVPVISPSYSGFVYGQNAGALGTTPTCSTTYTNTSPAGTYPNTCSGGVSSNYTFDYVAGSITVGQATPSLSWSGETKTYGAAPFTLTAPTATGVGGASVAGAYSYVSSNPAAATVSGSQVTIVGAGLATLTATFTPTSGNYASGQTVTASLTVNKANQSPLAFASANSLFFGQTLTLAASGGSGTGVVTFSAVDGTATGCSATSTLAYSSAGTCIVTVNRASDTNYFAATSVNQTVTINQAGQTVAFTSLVPTAPQALDTYTPTATAISTVTGASSGVTPTFTVSGACTISSGVVTFTAGTCTITAAAASNTNFTAAVNVTQVIVVGSINQNITFPQPSNKTYGSPSFAAGATASSDLSVEYSLGAGTTNAACSVTSIGLVTLLDIGTCEITASQPGQAGIYAPASNVTRAFQIVAALASAPTITSASASSQAITVGVAAPGFTGAPSALISAYRIVATPVVAGTTVISTSCTTSPCTISGLTNGTAYTVTVAAINSAGTGPASGATGSLTPATTAFAVGALAASPGNTTVTLTWTAPVDLGGGAFLHYQIARKIAGTSTWTTISTALNNVGTTTYTATGLDNGTSYDFQVAAITTANGSAIAGNTAEVVQYPSTAPGAPQNPTVLAATATDVQFSWGAPLSDGGSALSSPNYTVSVTGPGVLSSDCNPGATGTSCTIGGLTNGELYTFSVVANNRMGASVAATTTYAAPSSDDTLSDLVIAGVGGAVALTPVFDSTVLAYSASVTNGVASVTVRPTANVSGSAITVNGVVVLSGAESLPIALSVGVNQIDILVTASDPRFRKTYVVTITRAVAPSGGGGSANSGSTTPSMGPVTPPADVVSRDVPGAVLVNGVETPVNLVRNSSNSGWIVTEEAFTLSVEMETASGGAEPLAPSGELQSIQGGRIAIAGSGYAAETVVEAFLIRNGSAGATADRLNARSLVPDALYLGQAITSTNGAINTIFPIPANVDPGQYVLQINGLSPLNQMVSVNMATRVLTAPKPPTLRSGFVQRAAFYDNLSDTVSVEGAKKLRQMVQALPENATAVQVEVIGVSVSLDTLSSNLALAQKRAEGVADYLQDKGIKGTYTVTVTATFTTDGAERALRSSTNALTGSDGKPLTTATINFLIPDRG